MRTRFWASFVTAGAVLAVGGGRVVAGGSHDDVVCGPDFEVFATGLTNPRHIRAGPDGLLYVAEAGVGGGSLQVVTPDCPAFDNFFNQDGPYMGGLTGRVSRIHRDGRVEAVAQGIASFVDGTKEVLGPSDVAWIGRTLYVLTEGGGCTRGLPDSPSGVLRVNRDRSLTYVADITAFIRANPVEVEPICDPTGDCEPDGTPHSMIAVGPHLYVVEANHSSVLRVDPRNGAIRRLHDLSALDPAPIAIVRRGDHALIGGFHGDILKMRLFGGPVSLFQSGYNAIVDLLYFRDRLHVLETFTNADPWVGNAGRVVRRNRGGSSSLLVSGLNVPVGLEKWRGDLYVSQNSYFQGPVEGTGEIARIRCHGRDHDDDDD